MKKPAKYTYLISYVVIWEDGRYTHAYDYMEVSKDISLIEPRELEGMFREKAEEWAEDGEVPQIVPVFFQKLAYRAPSEGKKNSVSMPISMLGIKDE